MEQLIAICDALEREPNLQALLRDLFAKLKEP
jgi:hypothetical protein